MSTPEQRAKNAANMQKWRAANPERAREIGRCADYKRYALNPEKIKARVRKYRNENKELISERRRISTAADPSKNRTRALAWQKANPDRARARFRAWKKANPEKVRSDVIHRRARKRGADGRFSLADVEQLFFKQNGKCANFRCDVSLSDSSSVDHIIPLVLGGTNWPDNLQLLCLSCNSRKGKKTMEVWMAGP